MLSQWQDFILLYDWIPLQWGGAGEGWSLSIHQSVDSGCFCVLAIVNNATVSIGVHISYQINVFIVFG